MGGEIIQICSNKHKLAREERKMKYRKREGFFLFYFFYDELYVILYVYFNYSLANLACMHATLQNPG